MSVIHERIQPGAKEVRHYHPQAQQFFFVLRGTAPLEMAGRREILRRHERAEVPPNVPHQIFNEFGQEIAFPVISQPPAQGDRLTAETALRQRY